MKLRLRGDSLRLRLTRGEVDRLAESGRVEERTHLLPGDPGGPGGSDPKASLVYRLEIGTGFSACLVSGALTVVIPESEARGWIGGGRVGLEHDLRVGEGKVLRLLIEKDFRCLSERGGEDETDAFPHPGEDHGAVC